MKDKLDEFVDQLQEKIFDEAKEVLGEEGFLRWRNINNRKRMDNPDAHGKLTGTCGDTMEIFLETENGLVKDASYMTDGCGTSNVCASFAAEMAIGKNVEEMVDITGEAIMEKLGNLPENEMHCPFLAASTIQETIDDYMQKQRKT
ncbi:MAG: iron-sulfur cluster assembly scaffold protein [Desulfobacteraceae bacterium]